MVLRFTHFTFTYITCQTPIFCTPVIKNAYQAAASREPKSEFQHSLQGIYTRTARIIYPVDYVKTYS